MDRLYVVVPAYNEEENIEGLLEDWYPIVEHYGRDSRLLVVNDGSRDHTLDRLQEKMKKYTQLLVLSKENEGHGPTLMYGYQYALDQGADYIFQTDSDGQTDPNEFERFWELREKYDAVIGYRPDRKDGILRKFIEKILLIILRCTFGVSVPDSNAPFRLMRREILKKYLSKLPEKYNLPNVMLTTFFAYYHEDVRFEPITFKPRQKGKNSINIRKIAKIGWKAVGDFMEIKKNM